MVKIDRTGEEAYNNFGSKMVICRYKMNRDLDVFFPEYDWYGKNMSYNNFKNGQIKCPYEPRVYGVGYLGEGKYKISENGKHTKEYSVWSGMLSRCYSEKRQEKRPTYKGCIVCEEWLNFQNFAKWYDENYYGVNNEIMCLDKDILVHGNKIYSPETCLIVTERINIIITSKKNKNNNEPKGIRFKSHGYEVRCYDVNGTSMYLGFFKTIDEAFKVYKKFKERIIKQVADEYYSEGLIPKKVYEALYNYEVLITD